MTFKEDEKKEVGKILKDYVLQEREGSPGLLCENLGKKSAVFAGTAHWKDWDNTFPCIPAAQQEVCVLMGDRWHTLTELLLSEFLAFPLFYKRRVQLRPVKLQKLVGKMWSKQAIWARLTYSCTGKTVRLRKIWVCVKGVLQISKTWWKPLKICVFFFFLCLKKICKNSKNFARQFSSHHIDKIDVLVFRMEQL